MVSLHPVTFQLSAVCSKLVLLCMRYKSCAMHMLICLCHAFIPSVAAVLMICHAHRLAIVPMSQEARGLDAGQRLATRLVGAGDKRSADIVFQIALEEKAHVAVGG